MTASRDQFSEQAYDLLTSTAAQAAFKIDERADESATRYGRTPLGQACLLARRLIEAGVSFVTLNDRGMGQLGWDTHQQNFPTIKNTLAPPLDQGVAALSPTSTTAACSTSTLVVMMGEFGRTPKINPNAGRDHHGRANCACSPARGCRAAWSWARPTPRPTPPSTAPSLRPTSPDPICAGSTRTRSSRRPTDDPYGSWITASRPGS